MITLSFPSRAGEWQCGRGSPASSGPPGWTSTGSPEAVSTLRLFRVEASTALMAEHQPAVSVLHEPVDGLIRRHAPVHYRRSRRGAEATGHLRERARPSDAAGEHAGAADARGRG